MRIVLDFDNYFFAGSLAEYIECEYGTCQEYTGVIPLGYSSYEDWFVNCDYRNAYKLVNGNLVLDTDKEAELKMKIEQETVDNTPVLHKDLYGTNEVLNSQYQKETATGKILTLNNAKNIAPKVRLTNIDCYAFDKINLIVTGKNMLPNEAASKTIDGVYFIPNTDGSIFINGTATADIEYNLAGTSTNTSPFLVFKKGLNYYLSCGYTIKMYSYDGVDRTQVYSDTGGLINFADEDKKITQVTLSIPNGTTINDEKIYPMLNLGTTAEQYEKGKTNTLEIDFNSLIEEGLFPSDDLYPSDDLFPKGTTIDYIQIENNTVYACANGTPRYLMKANVSLFDGYNIVCTAQDTYLEMTYCINELAIDDLSFLQGKSTTTNKFKILEDGSIEAHNGYFSGDIYLDSGSKVIGGDGLLTNLQFQTIDKYSGYSLLGFAYNYGDTFDKLDVDLDVYIPENFKVVEAYATLYHTPVSWDAVNGDEQLLDPVTGYCRNIKLHKCSNNKNFTMQASMGGGFYIKTNELSGNEISEAFGSDGYTATNTSLPATIEITRSSNIANSLTKGNNKLFLRTSQNTSSYGDTDPYSPTGGYLYTADACSKTGLIKMVVDVIGYMNYE